MRGLTWIGVIAALAGLMALGWGRARAQQPQQHQHDHAAPKGDPLVRNGLVAAVAKAAAIKPAAARDELAAGASIGAIASAHGASGEAVLREFDALIDARMARAVERGRLPASVAQARAAWYKQSARLQLDQPGLSPRFPGLHEVHGLTIGAAVEATGLRRREILQRLLACATLREIAAERGVGDEALIGAARAQIDERLQPHLAGGMLSAERAGAWRAALEATAAKMIGTPGLHVAGKECAT